MKVEVILEDNRKVIIDNATSIKEENDFIVVEYEKTEQMAYAEPRMSFQKSFVRYMQVYIITVKNIELKISCPVLN